jgi:hypothetical protein
MRVVRRAYRIAGGGRGLVFGGTNLDTLLERGHLIAKGRGRRPGKKKKGQK